MVTTSEDTLLWRCLLDKMIYFFKSVDEILSATGQVKDIIGAVLWSVYYAVQGCFCLILSP